MVTSRETSEATDGIWFPIVLCFFLSHNSILKKEGGGGLDAVKVGRCERKKNKTRKTERGALSARALHTDNSPRTSRHTTKTLLTNRRLIPYAFLTSRLHRGPGTSAHPIFSGAHRSRQPHPETRPQPRAWPAALRSSMGGSKSTALAFAPPTDPACTVAGES